MNLDNLKRLYVDQLKELHSAENQLTEALPKMAKAASSSELRQAFEDHLDQTATHIQRIEMIFKGLSYSPRGKKCEAMAGLIEEGEELIATTGDPEIIDAGLIAAAQRVENYEIAGYDTVHKYAKLLGDEDAAYTIRQTLDEEYDADIIFDKLAAKISTKAMT